MSTFSTTDLYEKSVGIGGSVTQITSKATGVTLNANTGAITMHNANLATLTPVTFTLTNSAIVAGSVDKCVVVVNHVSAGTSGAYMVQANTIATGSCKITVFNTTAGTLGEAIVLNFKVIPIQVA